MDMIDDLMKVNVCSISEPTIVIIGSCLRQLYPEIVEELSSSGRMLHVCLEETHMNMVGFKVASILRCSRPENLIVVTVDGSPHCIQLHFCIEETLKFSSCRPKVKHCIVHDGKVREVSPEVVKTARYLRKVKRLLNQSNKIKP